VFAVSKSKQQTQFKKEILLGAIKNGNFTVKTRKEQLEFFLRWGGFHS